MSLPDPGRSLAEEVADFFGTIGQFLMLVAVWFLSLDEDENLYDEEH